MMLWLGCGSCLTTLAIGLVARGAISRGWFGTVSTGILGVAPFGSSYLCDLAWMRYVAVLLALPGVALLRRRAPDA